MAASVCNRVRPNRRPRNEPPTLPVVEVGNTTNTTNPKNVARDTGIEYHPGAVRFYQEAGIMPGRPAGESVDTADRSDGPAEQQPGAAGETPVASETTDQ